MKKIWSYVAILFAGIIGGLVAAIKLLDPKTTINATNYMEEQNQETKIGKIKQKKGEDNLQSVTQAPEQTLSRKERRKLRRQKKKERKQKSVLSPGDEKPEV